MNQKNRSIFSSIKTITATILWGFAFTAVLLMIGVGSVQAQEGGEVEYTIQPEDTMFEIAQSFDTTIATILAANPGIGDPDFILAGEVLVIPAADLPPRTAVLSPTNGPPGSTVQLRGEGYQPNRDLQILFGPQDSDAVTVKRIQADAQGDMEAKLILPDTAISGETWVASVQPLNQPGEYLEQSNTFEVEGAQDPIPVRNETSVYLVDVEDQGAEGELIGCGDSLVPVILPIEPEADPIRATLQNLFDQGEEVGPSGLYNSLYQSDLAVDEIDIKGETANLYLTGEMILGGVCDEPRLQAQLIETVNQFPAVSDVVVFLNGERAFAEEDDTEDPDLQTYTVQPNDVLSHIAVSFRTSVSAILNLNPDIQSPAVIAVGQEINIPGTDDDRPLLRILPTNGKPGTTVRYRAKNLLPHRLYTVGVGLINSEYETVMDIVTDEYGSSEGQVVLPEEADVNEYWVVVLDSYQAPDLRVVSNLFEVE